MSECLDWFCNKMTAYEDPRVFLECQIVQTKIKLNLIICIWNLGHEMVEELTFYLFSFLRHKQVTVDEKLFVISASTDFCDHLGATKTSCKCNTFKHFISL